MPPLTDVELPPIRHPALAAPYRPAHPSPTRDMLGLERMSAIELGYWGAQFAVDVPYLMYPLGWGEWEPLLAGDI